MPFALAAVLLSLERLCYVWIVRGTDSFERVAAGGPWRMRDPLHAVRVLFVTFKLLQAVVFVAWCWPLSLVTSSKLPTSPSVLGLALIVGGQLLSSAVFYRLGRVGVFYGRRFGHDVPWSPAFPFSLCNHPQYVGAVMSIWGFFLAARFPNDDWYLLPLVETMYYALGAHFEHDAPGGAERHPSANPIGTRDRSRDFSA
jgi:methylene-fatty-acyl-phospholipid synthase